MQKKPRPQSLDKLLIYGNLKNSSLIFQFGFCIQWDDFSPANSLFVCEKIIIGDNWGKDSQTLLPGGQTATIIVVNRDKLDQL